MITTTQAIRNFLEEPKEFHEFWATPLTVEDIRGIFRLVHTGLDDEPSSLSNRTFKEDLADWREAESRAAQFLTQHYRWEVWERDDFTCQWCGIRRNLSVDHIVPRSKLGSTTLDNLQTLCRSCNSRKRDRM